MATRELQALVLSHVAFEDLGSLRAPLEERGFRIDTVDAATAEFALQQAVDSDLLVILGGPIGVYETDAYPFLTPEIAWIRQRLEAGLPTLGVCLGAQLMAAALGARVYPGENGAEIGWAPIQFSGTGEPPEWFQPLLAPDLPVFHWHGDSFDLPAGAQPLARSQMYDNQAFSIGKAGLALQFHPEVTAQGLERWYVGHTSELGRRGISVPDLRAEGYRHAPRLFEAARGFWDGWLNYIL
ncbi:MAG TPA: glutamine amidotransferase [Terracidiphilus sp.]|jgi:GMP synthase (glutamine-hydrolysing)|nr:glutamine amidotransferase [Terracidiphilus sp.]